MQHCSKTARFHDAHCLFVYLYGTSLQCLKSMCMVHNRFNECTCKRHLGLYKSVTCIGQVITYLSDGQKQHPFHQCAVIGKAILHKLQRGCFICIYAVHVDNDWVGHCCDTYMTVILSDMRDVLHVLASPLRDLNSCIPKQMS